MDYTSYYYCSPLSWAKQSLPWPSTLVLILLCGLLLRLRRPKLNRPPGPRPWPIIGNLNLIGPLPHHSLHNLSLKYGPLMHLQLGSVPAVVASSADMARAFLKTHDLAFASRPVTTAAKITAYNCLDMLWAPYGSYWRQVRKIFMMELFATNRIESYKYIRDEEMNALLRGLFQSTGEPVVLNVNLLELNLNIVSRMVLGKKYTKKSSTDPVHKVTLEEFKEIEEEWMLLNGTANLGDLIPWIEFMDLQGYRKRMESLRDKFNHFLEHVLDDHSERKRREGGDFVAKDIVDVLLQFVDDPNNDLDVKIDRTGVKGLIADVLVGGTDTSTVTVEWAISEVLKNPQIYEKAIDELDRTIGKDRWVQEKDIVNLPYLEAIVKETMRLHPAVPIPAPHFTVEDVNISGYDIPKGTRALVNVWAIGRDPEVWGNPEQFDPDRFVGKSIDVKGQDFELLPFGAGRRMCPAYNLGLKVIQSSLANVLHGFTWEFPGGASAQDLDMDETFRLSSPKKIPLVVIGKPRLPVGLYSDL